MDGDGHIFCHKGTEKTLLSAYWLENAKQDVTAEHISRGVKVATTMLHYPSKKGIPIQQINMHSLHSGGANALSLSGYSDTQIQKMGR